MIATETTTNIIDTKNCSIFNKEILTYFNKVINERTIYSKKSQSPNSKHDKEITSTSIKTYG